MEKKLKEISESMIFLSFSKKLLFSTYTTAKRRANQSTLFAVFFWGMISFVPHLYHDQQKDYI